MTKKLWGLYFGVKFKMMDFMKKEKGSAEIIGAVVVIAITLVLAGIFWDKLKEFFGTLWAQVTGKNTVDSY